MKWYMDKYKQVQKVCFEILEEYPRDRATLHVLNILEESDRKNLELLFKWFESESPTTIYNQLKSSGSVEKIVTESCLIGVC